MQGKHKLPLLATEREARSYGRSAASRLVAPRDDREGNTERSPAAKALVWMQLLRMGEVL